MHELAVHNYVINIASNCRVYDFIKRNRLCVVPVDEFQLSTTVLNSSS